MEERSQKYLPIGTVVLLKEAEKPLMITGFSSIEDDNPKNIYDFIGCEYPEGMVDLEEVELFNYEDIGKILYLGYDTDESKKYSKEVESLTLEYLDDIKSEEINAQNNVNPTPDVSNQPINNGQIPNI